MAIEGNGYRKTPPEKITKLTQERGLTISAYADMFQG